MELDPAMVASLQEAWVDEQVASTEHFSITEELLAQVLEMLSVIRVEALVIARVKKHDLPDVLRVPRPGQEAEDDHIPVVSPREFLMMVA